jgi:tetratricopeptide (TPR) repeat protein
MTTDDDNKAGDDQTSAQHSQGFIGQASGPVSQNFGAQTNIDTGGGNYIDTGGGDLIGGDKVLGDKVLGAKNIIIQPPPMFQSLHQLRAPVGDFVGREREIDQLVQALSKTSGVAAAISGVRGMGGVGKTELAYVLASRLKDIFTDAQLLVELRGASSKPLEPEQALQTVIRSFEREVKLPDDLSQLKGVYNSVLAGKRVLILADDAKDVTQVRPLMPPQGCALLVTSRNRFGLPGMAALDLGTLPSEQAEQLLLEMCPRIGEHADALIKLCGSLPLALRVSASLLREDDSRDVGRYLNQLRVERLKHLTDPHETADPQASVEASLRLSYDILDLAGQEALCQMSVFPASFDEEAAQVVVNLNGTASWSLRLKRWLGLRSAARILRLEDVLSNLRQHSLLEWDAVAKRYSLHELVRAFGAARLKDADTIQLRYARHYVGVMARVDELYHQGGEHVQVGLALFDRERTHIDNGWNWAMTHANNPDTDALLLDYASTTITISGLRYDTRRERIPQVEAAVGAAQRIGDRGFESIYLNLLGHHFDAVGEGDRAIACYEQLLAITHELGDRRAEVDALVSLGHFYANVGEIQRAIELLEQSLAIARELADKTAERASLKGLGIAYAKAGDARQAIELLEQSLAIARELADKTKEEKGVVLKDSETWRVYANVVDIQQALELTQQRSAIVVELSNWTEKSTVLIHLGDVYVQVGETQKALDCYEQSLKIARRIGEQSMEGTVLGRLGIFYDNVGDKHRAIRHYEQALTIAGEIGDRQMMGLWLTWLMYAHADCGEQDRAIRYAEQASIALRESGEGQLLLGQMGWIVSNKLAEQGDLARAVELMQVYVDFLREIGHPDAEKRAVRLEELRRRLAAEQGTTPAKNPDEG